MSEPMKRLLPKLLFTFGLAAVCIWYLWDAASGSTSITNLLLILPATLLAVLLCLVVAGEDIAKALRRKTTDDDPEEADDRFDWRIPVLMVLVGGFVAVTMTVGFVDVATIVFVAATLALLGERRPWVIVVFSVAFSFVVVMGLKETLTYDVSTLLF